MLAFALYLTFGVLLALSFRVFVLVPATFLVIIVGVVGDTAGTESLWMKLLTAATAATALQAGYLVGIFRWISQPPPIARMWR